MTAIVVLGVLALLGAALLVASVRIAPEYQRIIVFRLGRALGAKGPGLVLLVPIVDRGVRVDLRERFFEVTPQTCITQDNASVSIDFLVYLKIVDPMPSVLNVERHDGAARGIAITTLRAVVGAMLLDDVLAKRENINNALRGKLDEVTNRWGIKVTAVEIREVVPPREVLEAMTRQMSAERSRRAAVTEAEGRREAGIRMAEGERQATILRAEGNQQAAVLRADGDARALARMQEVARDLDDRTMTLQYLGALRAVGASSSSKILVPMELVSLVKPFAAMIGGAENGGAGAGGRASGRAANDGGYSRVAGEADEAAGPTSERRAVSEARAPGVPPGRAVG